MHRLLTVTVLILALCLGACERLSGAPVLASDIRITTTLPGQNMSAGYLTLSNNSDSDITITNVDSDAYRKITIHESRIEEGVSKMRAIDSLRVAARSSIELTPGGKHLMLVDRNDSDVVTFRFYSDETLILAVTVPTTDEDHQ